MQAISLQVYLLRLNAALYAAFPGVGGKFHARRYVHVQYLGTPLQIEVEADKRAGSRQSCDRNGREL